MTTTPRHLVGLTGAQAPGDPLEDFASRLYAEHRAPLLRYVRRLLAGDRHRAEDVVQETLLRAWRSADRLAQQEASILPWLFKVARNIVIDWSRRDQVRPRESDPAGLESVADPDNMADRIIDRRLLADAMSTLSDPHRQTMFHLLYLGRTTKQTATAMGVPIGTAKSRAHYAGRALQQALIGGGVRAA